MSAENHVAIDIDLRPLVMSRGIWRQKTIQRYKDIIGLCDRFEFPITLSSNARSVVELKSVREMVGLASVVGIAEPDARKALSVISSLISPDGPVQVVG
jgi:ribonuclease P/MRP protein subunit RPP1